MEGNWGCGEEREMEPGREMGRNPGMERNTDIGEEIDKKNGEGKGRPGEAPGGEGRAEVMGALLGTGCGGSGGKRVELPSGHDLRAPGPAQL